MLNFYVLVNTLIEKGYDLHDIWSSLELRQFYAETGREIDDFDDNERDKTYNQLVNVFDELIAKKAD